MRTCTAFVVPLFGLAAGALAQVPAAPPAQQQPQEPPPPTQEPKPEPPPPTAEPVIVEARRWQEDLADVPQSLTVVKGEQLERAGTTRIRDAGATTPNLFFNEFTAERLSFPTMRGIGSGQGDPAVVTYVSGVPQLTTNTTNLPLVDVERIEFLRGPQSTLFGRNALGGVIQIFEKQPSRTLGASASGTFGNFGLQQYQVSASGPLVAERVHFRLSGVSTQRDGYSTNDFTGNDVDDRDQLYGRAELEWMPDDAWELDLRIEGSEARDGGFALSELTGLRARPHHIDQDYEGRADRDTAGVSFVATRSGDGVDFTSVSSLQRWEILENADFDFSTIDGVRRRTEESQDAFYQELRLSSTRDRDTDLGPGVTSKWLLGVSGFVADTSRAAANDYRPGGAGILFPPMQVGVDTSSGEFEDWGAAAFGQFTVTLAKTWDLGVGLRWDHEEKHADLRRTFETGGFVASDVRQDLDADHDELAPQASLGCHVTDDALLHARFAKGFKAGGFNLAAPAGQLAYAPETSTTWEVGARTAWLAQRLHVDVALFQIDWDDMQLSQFDAAVGGYVANAGAATSRGGEIEVRAIAGGGLEFTGAFGWTDATFDRFTDPYGVDVAGRNLAYAPSSTQALGVEYVGEMPDCGRWFVGVDWHGVGTYWLDAANRQSESFDLFGCHAGVEVGQLRFAMWARNLLDEEYVQVAFQPNPADPSVFVGENGAPRTFGLELTLRF